MPFTRGVGGGPCCLPSLMVKRQYKRESGEIEDEDDEPPPPASAASSRAVCGVVEPSMERLPVWLQYVGYIDDSECVEKWGAEFTVKPGDGPVMFRGGISTLLWAQLAFALTRPLVPHRVKLVADPRAFLRQTAKTDLSLYRTGVYCITSVPGPDADVEEWKRRVARTASVHPSFRFVAHLDEDCWAYLTTRHGVACQNSWIDIAEKTSRKLHTIGKARATKRRPLGILERFTVAITSIMVAGGDIDHWACIGLSEPAAAAVDVDVKGDERAFRFVGRVFFSPE